MMSVYGKEERATMNKYLKHSLEYAAQKSYLDDLFRVYPSLPGGLRDIDEAAWNRAEVALSSSDNAALVRAFLAFDKFPFNDPYIAFLRSVPSALDNNPATADRLAGRLRELGANKLYELCSSPKEANRKLGPAFHDWLAKGELGLKPVSPREFLANKKNAILSGTDRELAAFAREHLNYRRNKGLDFVARFRRRYVIGEAKFLTASGGHQTTQFNDALATLREPDVNAVKVAILDGVVYAPGRGRMYTSATGEFAEANIMSALVLREFLYEL